MRWLFVVRVLWFAWWMFICFGGLRDVFILNFVFHGLLGVVLVAWFWWFMLFVWAACWVICRCGAMVCNCVCFDLGYLGGVLCGFWMLSDFRLVGGM